MQHRHPVAQVEGLLLLVGDQDGGDAHPLDGPLELAAGALAQGGIEVGERLVEQQDAGLGRQGAGQGHPLLLAARDLPHPPCFKTGKLHQRQGLGHPAGGLPLSAPGDDAEGHVLAHGEMGEQGVVLEDHAEMPALGRQGGDVLALHPDAAAVRRLEAGDQAQGRGLAAARGTQQGEDLPLRHLQRQAAQDGLDTEALVELLQGEEGHGKDLNGPRRRARARCGPRWPSTAGRS